MGLCGPTELGELTSHDAGLGNRSQHADSGFAPLQFPAYAVAVGLAEAQVLLCKGPSRPPPIRPAPSPTGVTSATATPIPAPLPTLRLPTLSVLSSPLSFRARTPMASPFATPVSFKDAAAMSATASSLKIARTTVLFDMNIPFRCRPGAAIT